MKRTLNIHLGRQLFIIEEDAYEKLQVYLKQLERQFHFEESMREILEDIEMRFAELLQLYLGTDRKVVELKDVEQAIGSLGTPESIVEESELNSDEKYSSNESNENPKKRLFRDPENAVLGGVCSGIGAYFNIDPVIVRLIFILLTLTGFSFFMYIVLWVIIPQAISPSDRLQMKGKTVTIDSLKEEINSAAERIKSDALRVKDNFKQKQSGLYNESVRLRKIIFRILGVGFIVFAFISFIFYVTIVTGYFNFIPTNGTFEDTNLYDFLALVFPNETKLGLIWTAILIGGLCFCLGLLNTGIRLFMDRKHYFLKIVGIATAIGFTLSVILGFIGGTHLLRDFSVQTEIEVESLSFASSKLEVTTEPEYYNNKKVYSTDGIDFIELNGNKIVQEGITLTYKASKDSIFHVLHIQRAHGKNKNEAAIRCNHIKNEFYLKNNVLHLNPKYSYPKKDGIREQEVEVIIEVPINKELYINGVKQPILFDNTEEQNFGDRSGMLFTNKPFESLNEY